MIPPITVRRFRVAAAILTVLFLLAVFGCAPRGKRPVEPAAPKTVGEKHIPALETAPKTPGPVRGFSPAAQDTAETFARHIDIKEQDLTSWKDLGLPLLRSLEYIQAHDQTALAVRQPGLRLTWGQLGSSVSELIALLPALKKNPELLAERFTWYRLAPEPLMTGYYAPAIDASLTPRPGYKYPIYGLPADLERLDLGEFHPRWRGQRLIYRTEGDKALPYFDRREIDIDGALNGRGLEIAWAKHPWDIYHLQVQGSGFLRLPDGDFRYVLYAGQNGRRFRSTARYMLETGKIARNKLDRDGIRSALDKAGSEGKMELLAHNPSYVFFKLGDVPPEGSIGKPLTGMVSLATDPSVLPLGAIVPFSVELPTEPGQPRKRVYGLGLAQDTGGVIKGHRIDFYCGIGDKKEYMAFRIKNPVTTYIMVSKRVLAHK
ncbi:MAG: MltA domain-containing protein [Desulfovibrio sp.]|uniref:MltA domain-containing protein n=1 Tax=Desulfovibrio sp. 7SRBS1 TaxID=3378064 RepID=UPI003B3FF66E